MEADSAYYHMPRYEQDGILVADEQDGMLITDDSMLLSPAQYNPVPFAQVVDQLYMMNGFSTVPLGEFGVARSRFRFGGLSNTRSQCCGCTSCNPGHWCLQGILKMICPCCSQSSL